MRSVRVAMPLVCAALGVTFAGPARAEARCAPLVIEAAETLRGLEAELPEQVRRALQGRVGIDTCARVKLGKRAAAITVDVELEDGRRATRVVPSREDVISTLEALLFVPDRHAALSEGEPEPAAASEAATISTAAPATLAGPLDAATRPKAPPSAPQPPPQGVFDAATPRPSPPAGVDDRLGVELSVVTGARVGDGQSSLGLGALSLLELWGWLAGFEARADSYAFTTSTPHATLELAALAGRRVRFESLALDVVLGPALALTGESTTETAPPVIRTTTPPGAVPRLLVRSQLHFAPRSVLRTFIGVDAEVGARGPSEAHLADGLPGLPVWMVGLALGATLGTR